MKLTGIILAGGKSSRMGKDKSLLNFNNKTLITQMTDTLKKVTSINEIFIVSNESNKYSFSDVKEISDIYPNKGPLGGIHAGLLSANNDYAFITACDMPFVNNKLIEYIISESFGFDVTSPKINNSIEPLCAVYSNRCLPYVEESLEENIRCAFDFYSKVKVNYLSEDKIKAVGIPEKIFYNVNTPKDYDSIK